MNVHEKPAQGLSSVEAEARLQQVGPNVMKTRAQTSIFVIFIRQFKSTLIIILIIAALLAAAMGEIVDAVAVSAIIFLNGIFGFVQEWRAERTLDALRSMLSSKALVRRDGLEREVDTRDLVPGDCVIVEAGDKVPADMELTTSLGLRLDESILTGESESVAKSAKQSAQDQTPLFTAFMGTSVVHGRGEGIVTNTGMATRFGEIAALTSGVEDKPTQLQQKLGRLGQRIGLFAIFVASLIVPIGWISGKAIEEMVLTSLSLAVALVPEGLPAVVTVTLALGARAMLKRNALSRRLQATETLGAASVICTDKTGTLTENEMTVARIWLPEGFLELTGTGYDPAGHFEKGGERFEPQKSQSLNNLLTSGVLCNHARLENEDGVWTKIGDPTEVSIIVAAHKAWLDMPERSRVIREIPFSSERKLMSVLASDGEDYTVHAKGAPDVIVARCIKLGLSNYEIPIDDALRATFEAAYHDMASSGLRVLAIARKHASRSVSDDEMENDLTLLGLVGIIDPPRPEVQAAIEEAQTAGVKVVMITGDAPETALAIAHMLNFPAKQAATGAMLDKTSDDQLSQYLAENVVFARTAPVHKMRIVECLQGQNAIVAMTGDGVNDAPALKRADIGVAMGIRGTDVSKDAADIVLLDDNFASIVNAIEEGRRQYENIKKFVRYLLCSNAGEVVAIVVNLFVGGPLIFLPIQILWMNLVTDGPTALTLGLERSEPDSMKRPPRAADEEFISRRSLFIIAMFAAYTGSASLFAFYSVLDHGVIVAQTVAFTTMIFLEKLSVFAFRSLNLPLSRVGYFSNGWLLFAVICTLGLQVVAVYWTPLQAVLHTTAISAETWLMIIGLTLPVLIAPELVKRLGVVKL